MTVFNSSQYDIPTLIEKLHDQRFDGYDSNSLADEVEKFRGGAGTASMSNAVEALKSVVSSLATTDATLRKQLSALGVTWQGQASDQAGAVMAEQAGFAGQAYDNVTKSAELIFEQSEAFNRTKNKLPDPEKLRQGDGGYSFTDTLFSLFGFETDHASAVKANTEARAQAVDALNAYAHDSGNYLASSQAVPAPQTLETAPPPPAPAPLPDVGADGTPPVPDTAPTVAAGAKDAFPAPTRSVPVHQPAPPPVVETPTPPIGVPGPSVISAPTVPQSTIASSAPQAQAQAGSTAPPVTATGGGSGAGLPENENLVSGRGGLSGTPAGTIGVFAPGPQTGGNPGGFGGFGGGSGGTGGFSGGFSGGTGGFGGGTGGAPGGIAGVGQKPVPGGVPGQGGGEAAMGKGQVVGATASPPQSGVNVGPGATGARPPGGVGAAADSATAIGAGVAGGAVSGEDERRGRGVGRSTAAERGKPVRQLDVGDLPEEEEAQRANRATPQTPSSERTRAILEPAATQDDDPDTEHVRRYGIDDKDLFTDQREVSPDLIGDRPIPEDR